MSRAVLILDGRMKREQAKRWIDRAPANARLELKEAKRSLDQNSAMWARLTEVAVQVQWRDLFGRPFKMTPDQWKIFFLEALGGETALVPNLAGTGVVNLGRSSSDLSKTEMGAMLDLIEAFGAEHGVTFADQKQEEPA